MLSLSTAFSVASTIILFILSCLFTCFMRRSAVPVILRMLTKLCCCRWPLLWREFQVFMRLPPANTDAMIIQQQDIPQLAEHIGRHVLTPIAHTRGLNLSADLSATTHSIDIDMATVTTVPPTPSSATAATLINSAVAQLAAKYQAKNWSIQLMISAGVDAVSMVLSLRKRLKASNVVESDSDLITAILQGFIGQPAVDQWITPEEMAIAQELLPTIVSDVFVIVHDVDVGCKGCFSTGPLKTVALGLDYVDSLCLPAAVAPTVTTTAVPATTSTPTSPVPAVYIR